MTPPTPETPKEGEEDTVKHPHDLVADTASRQAGITKKAIKTSLDPLVRAKCAITLKESEAAIANIRLELEDIASMKTILEQGDEAKMRGPVLEFAQKVLDDLLHPHTKETMNFDSVMTTG